MIDCRREDVGCARVHEKTERILLSPQPPAMPVEERKAIATIVEKRPPLIE